MDVYSNKEVLVGRVVFDPTLSHKTSYLPTVRNNSDSDTLFPLTPADFDEVHWFKVEFKLCCWCYFLRWSVYVRSGETLRLHEAISLNQRYSNVLVRFINRLMCHLACYDHQRAFCFSNPRGAHPPSTICSGKRPLLPSYTCTYLLLMVFTGCLPFFPPGKSHVGHVYAYLQSMRRTCADWSCKLKSQLLLSITKSSSIPHTEFLIQTALPSLWSTENCRKTTWT